MRKREGLAKHVFLWGLRLMGAYRCSEPGGKVGGSGLPHWAPSLARSISLAAINGARATIYRSILASIQCSVLYFIIGSTWDCFLSKKFNKALIHFIKFLTQ